MSSEINTTAKIPGPGSLHWRRRVMRLAIVALFVGYSVLTLVPFYFLFVRTFVSTAEATELHLWPPPTHQVNMDYTIGGMAEFNSLDIKRFKADFGISGSTYIKPAWTLTRVAEEFDIPVEELEAYFFPFVNYNGWFTLLRNSRFWIAFVRSIVVTVAGLIGLNILSIFTGTGLAGLKYRYQTSVFRLYLFSMVVPFFLILLPQYVSIQTLLNLIPGYAVKGSNVRQLGQLLVLVMLYVCGSPLSTMLFTSYVSTIPHELEESAEIDGASRWQYLRYIQLPLMKVPIASMTVIALPYMWNDFMNPFIYTDVQYTTLLPLVNSFIGHYATNFQVIFTSVFFTMLPLLVIYILFRKWFIRGVMAGAIKG